MTRFVPTDAGGEMSDGLERPAEWHEQWEGMCGERNYAQERIEQLERERDEARQQSDHLRTALVVLGREHRPHPWERG